MQNCVSEVKPWMECNKLKLNDIQFILMESDRIMLPDFASIRIGNSDIPFVTHARSLEITISSNTTMEKHVTNICRSAYAEVRRINRSATFLQSMQPKLSSLPLFSQSSSSHHISSIPWPQGSLGHQKWFHNQFPLKVRLLQLSPLLLTSIHSG